MVKYHGLARRHLTPPPFLMRPLLNGGTLGRQRANRNLLASSLVIEQAADRLGARSTTAGRPARARAGGLRCFGRGRRDGWRQQTGTRAQSTFGSLSLPVAKQSAVDSWPPRTLVSTAAGPSRSQGCPLNARFSLASGARSASRSSAAFRLETMAPGRASLAVLLCSVLVPLLPNKLLQLPAAPRRHLRPPACRPW